MAAARRAKVVLLHGQPGTGAGWRGVVAALGDDFDVVAPDRPGYRSNREPPGGLAHNADWVASVVEAGADEQPTVVVGHSWAGGIALELAARRPESVQGLVLLASVGPGAVT